jgi:hypothetical protein
MKTCTAARLPFPVAAGFVIALAVPYTALNTLFPGPMPTYALGLVIAALGLGVLWLAGMPPGACFVRLAPLSRRGAWVLIGLSLYMPAVALAGVSHPWHWVDGLVYAPASALGQELYFRGALLATLSQLSPARPWLAVVLQALTFAVWHLRAFRVVSPGLALLVLGGTLIAGALWGWQTRRDGTLLYACVEHAAFLIVV